MQFPHGVVITVGCTFWLIAALVWQLHKERGALEQERNRPLALELRRKTERVASLEASIPIIQRGAAAQYQRALVAEGRLSQVMAECPASY